MLFIPLIFMNLFTFNNAIRQLTEEVEDATMTKLKQTADVIDARLEGLNHIAAQLPRDQHIRSFLYAQNINKMSEYDFYLMIKALSDYRATNTFIDNIYILKILISLLVQMVNMIFLLFLARCLATIR